MKKIRSGVFETNSSSSHSISLGKESEKSLLQTITPNYDGKIILVGGDFGWDWEKFNDAETKANYCAQVIHDYYADNSHRLAMLKRVIREQTKACDVEILSIETGYVDHNSKGKEKPIFESEDSLRNFIFNPESWLFTGNDNECAPPNFFDNCDPKEYKWTVELEGTKEEYKFVKKPKKEDIIEALKTLWDRHPLKNDFNMNVTFSASYGYPIQESGSLEDIDKKIFKVFVKKWDSIAHKWEVLEPKNLSFMVNKINVK